jgi:hypothetical protein
MPVRGRTLANLRADAYKRADVESATDRHPPADVTRLINQGAAELRDLLIEIRGRSYFRKHPPQKILTTGNQTRYPLAPDFYQLISVRLCECCLGGDLLIPFSPHDEPELRASAGGRPTHYELQDGHIELLPKPHGGLEIVADYIATYTDLVNDSDVLEGFHGWEDYPVLYAARAMAMKDEELELVSAIDGELSRLAARIRRMAGHRDRFRAEQVKDVRRTRFFIGNNATRWSRR